MNLYLLTQDENDSYDTYDSCVVAAPDEDIARRIHPSDGSLFVDSDAARLYGWGSSAWARTPDAVAVRLIGQAADGIEQGVICASYNAG